MIPCEADEDLIRYFWCIFFCWFFFFVWVIPFVEWILFLVAVWLFRVELFFTCAHHLTLILTIEYLSTCPANIHKHTLTHTRVCIALWWWLKWREKKSTRTKKAVMFKCLMLSLLTWSRDSGTLLKQQS